MSIQLIASILFSLFMFGLWVMVNFLIASKEDPISMYKLYKVRDLLVRLVALQKIDRYNPYFESIYRNVNTLLAAGHELSGPEGWKEAEIQGQMIARDPSCAKRLTMIPPGDAPEVLNDAIDELKDALIHMLNNHLGVFIQIDSHRREIARIQKEKAKKFLEMMQESSMIRA